MRYITTKRYKIVLNVEIDDPNEEYPAGGDYMHLNRIQGYVHSLGYCIRGYEWMKATIDKVIDKGPIPQRQHQD